MGQGLFKTRDTEVKKVLEDLIHNDDKDGFVSFIRSHLGNDKSGSAENMLHSGDIMMWICSHGAKGCAAALLEGETGLDVDLNVPLKDGCYPLHLAAENLSPSLTDLFLRHGARTDLPCSKIFSKHPGMLPLSVALEALPRHQFLSDWNPTKSIFKLISVLCLPKLQEPLKVLKLLSERTQELEQISSSTARQGKLVELAGLLFVAWNKLLAPASDDGVDSSILGQCLMETLVSLIDQEYKLIRTHRTEELNECRKMKTAVLSASLMLTVFERSGEVIDLYRLLCFKHFGSLRNPIWLRTTTLIFKQLGFALKQRDTDFTDMRCSRIGLKPGKEDELHRSIDQMLNSKSKSSGQAQILASLDGRGKQKQQFLNDPAVSGLVQPPFSSVRSLHTYQLSSRSGPKLCAPSGAHQMNMSKQPMSFSVTRCAYCALTSMRRMRCLKLI